VESLWDRVRDLEVRVGRLEGGGWKKFKRWVGGVLGGGKRGGRVEGSLDGLA